MAKHIINSEASFLELANSFLAGNCDIDAKDIIFDGWPNINVYLQGERYNASLPASAMEGLLDLQEALLQGYAQLVHDSSDLRRLRGLKQQMELVFYIKEGSSDTSAPADGYLNSLLEGMAPMFDNMSGDQALIAVLFMTTAIAGVWMFKLWQENKTDRAVQEAHTKQIEKVSESSIQQSQQLTDLSKHNASTLKEVADIMMRGDKRDVLPPDARQFARTVEDGYESVARKVSDADFATIGVEQFDHETLVDFAKRRKKSRAHQEFKGIGYVDAIKKKAENDYAMATVTFNNRNSYTLKADHFLGEDQLDLLYFSLKEDTPLNIECTLIMANNKFEEGRISNVYEPNTASQKAQS